jgi:hypothetical protein
MNGQQIREVAPNFKGPYREAKNKLESLVGILIESMREELLLAHIREIFDFRLAGVTFFWELLSPSKRRPDYYLEIYKLDDL